MADRVLFKDFLNSMNIHSPFDGRQGVVIQGLFLIVVNMDRPFDGRQGVMQGLAYFMMMWSLMSLDVGLTY